MGSNSDGDKPILNACLAYIKFLMHSRDKLFTVNAVCSKFDLNSIKAAREIIYKLMNPESDYSYRGPNGAKTDREKSVHALEGILAMLKSLDQNGGLNVTFACPSDQLFLILEDTNETSSGNFVNSSRFRDLENKVAEIDMLKSAIIDLQSTISSVISLPNKLSTGAGDSGFPPLSRDRSSSNVSVKRSRIDSAEEEVSTVDNQGFVLPKKQQKKLKLREMQSTSGTGTYAKLVKDGTPKPTTSKKQFTWGKALDKSSVGLRGAVPDVFLFRCDSGTTPIMVENHLSNEGISIAKIEQKSSSEARFKSFKISPQSVDDFDKLISGDHIPRYMKVREWIYYKIANKDKGNANGDDTLSNRNNSEETFIEVEVPSANGITGEDPTKRK